MHQAGSDALLTLSTFFKFIKIYMKNSAEKKYMNVLEGIPLHTDDLWKKAIPDYSFMMFNHGYGMHNMPTMVENPYYNQPEVMFNGAVNNNLYKMHYYAGYAANSFQELNQKPKKFEPQGGKPKNQSKN